jgi:hypothetical protein
MKKRHKSAKGKLIKGMTKKLPSEILKDPTFTSKLKELMKGYAGIYALYRENTLYYVGLTKDLFGRINWHLKDRHKGKWDKFIIFRIKRVNYLKDIETLLTHIVDTKGNRAKGRVPEDSDLNKVLREILMERGKEYTKLKRVFDKE